MSRWNRSPSHRLTLRRRNGKPSACAWPPREARRRARTRWGPIHRRCVWTRGSTAALLWAEWAAPQPVARLFQVWMPLPLPRQLPPCLRQPFPAWIPLQCPALPRCRVLPPCPGRRRCPGHLQWMVRWRRRCRLHQRRVRQSRRLRCCRASNRTALDTAFRAARSSWRNTPPFLTRRSRSGTNSGP